MKDGLDYYRRRNNGEIIFVEGTINEYSAEDSTEVSLPDTVRISTDGKEEIL